MKILKKHEIKMVGGGARCLCRYRQYHTENYTRSNWYMFDGKQYEDLVAGHASSISECLDLITMMHGNLFKSCLTLIKEDEGWGKSSTYKERKTEL